MKIAIDISPLQSGHSVRGQGFYLSRLKDALEKYFPTHTYLFFEGKSPHSDSYDLIHFPYFDPFFLTLPFPKNKKTIVTVHDLTPLVFPTLFPIGVKGKVKWEVQKQSLRRAVRVITDSYASKRDISRLTQISESKIDVVYLAAGEEFKVMDLSSAQTDQVRGQYDLPEKFILYVGDVTANKNLVRLVTACKERNLPLVMVGKSLTLTDYDTSHPWNRELAKVQELTSSSSHIKLLGFVSTEDLVTLYNLATVFVFPSLYEGFGLPVLEAMQCGCPVITTKGGSLEEVSGDAAYFVDPLSTTSIGEGIEKVFGDEKLRAELKRKGIDQAERFTWKKTAEETIKSYEAAYK